MGFHAEGCMVSLHDGSSPLVLRLDFVYGFNTVTLQVVLDEMPPAALRSFSSLFAIKLNSML
eukprot:2145184-Amphidinium_carterae.1